MSMSKKDFIAAADMVKEISKEIARESRCADIHTPVDYSNGFNRAMRTAQDIVLDEVVEFCKKQRAPGRGRFNEGRFRDYVNGLCGPNGGEIKTKKAVDNQ